ncbi:WAT1-related protein At3g02690, chloroplastic isoform X2 [Malania oleifera]|uniref:WAT1-related protein At3g02690, chloroplastic isoform X2 n=2 Tax=Malania oleifera TaxID=397392 RepID=UPI0025AEA473|nr:WAT1-related protein At3g02690, chloroplastic isoform X2 [Malania oleifera]
MTWTASPSGLSTAVGFFVLPTNSGSPYNCPPAIPAWRRRFLDFRKRDSVDLQSVTLATSGTTTTTTAIAAAAGVRGSYYTNMFNEHSGIRDCSVGILNFSSNGNSDISRRRRRRATESNVEVESESSSTTNIDCVGTGLNVECMVSSPSENEDERSEDPEEKFSSLSLGSLWWEWAVLVSPFFFWGTAMVAMKQVVPRAGPFFVGAFRLIPAGFFLIGYAAYQGRKLPSGLNAWLSITLFALVDAACFQGFLAEGLQRTSAGLGSVIIDSQPLTVAILAALFFGEAIGFVGAAGLVLVVIGLLLLEVPALSLKENNFSLWGSGEWWMLLAAQSMAIGTVMVRWVSKYSDPVMATGWHMVIGGLPLVAVSLVNHDPALSGSFKELTVGDFSALLYTSILGSAVSYGVFFYNATRGSLTKLSSLTFLTPMFASFFGSACLRWLLVLTFQAPVLDLR